MNLADYLMYCTVGVFALGAAFALAWSLAAGQWRDREAGARVVLEEGPISGRRPPPDREE